MAKFIKYTHPHIFVCGTPQASVAEEMLISVDDIRSLCHNKDGYFIYTKLMDSFDCDSKIASFNTTIKVSKEDYELTKKVLDGGNFSK